MRVVEKQKEEEEHERMLNREKLAAMKTNQTTLVGQMTKND